MWYTVSMRYLLLLLLACAAPPREYRDGARLPSPVPRTTYAPVGAGLPEYFAEPERKPDIQPNPRPTRLLPPERGPGIWATHASDDGYPEPLLLKVLLPVPLDAESDIDREVVSQCARTMTTALVRAKVERVANELPPVARVCLAARLYFACATGMVDDLESLSKSLRYFDATHTGAARKMKRMASGFHDAACTPSERKATEALANAATNELLRLRGKAP